MVLKGGGKWKDLVQRLLTLGYIDQDVANSMNNDLRTLTAQGVKWSHGFEAKKNSVLYWLNHHLENNTRTNEERRRLRNMIERIRGANSHDITWNVVAHVPPNFQTTINPLATANAVREEINYLGMGKSRRCTKCRKLRGGSKWNFIKSLGDQILSIREQNKEITSKQQYTAPYPFHVGKRPEIKIASLISEPKIDVELNKLIREGAILKGEKEYFKRKLEQYLQLSLAQRNKFSVKEPIYSKMTPEQYFKGIISRDDAEDKLLQYDQPENMTDEEYERILTLFDNYAKKLPTKAQLKKKSKSVEEEMKAQNAALAALQGTRQKF